VGLDGDLMANPVEKLQQDLVEEFALFDDWMERYEYIIDLGKQLPDFPEKWRTADNRIHGCQSQVWFNMFMQDGRLHIDGISDALIVTGLIAVLIQVYSGQVPADIIRAKPDFIADIGFNDHLSPTRSNGLHHMVKAIYAEAARHA
jgi:cysteine desulfuration protein SufE